MYMYAKNLIWLTVEVWKDKKENRSTEGCSKLKVRRQDKFRRDWSQH